MKKVVLTLYNFYGCKTDPSHCRRMASDPAMIPRTYSAKPSFAPPSDPYECVPAPTGEAILSRKTASLHAGDTPNCWPPTALVLAVVVSARAFTTDP